MVVIGVHTPEFEFEHELDNVRRAAAAMGIIYAIAVDNDYEVWRAFANHYWPALYFVDAASRIRHHRFGEGDYERSEMVIQQLVAAAGINGFPDGLVGVDPGGAEAAADWVDLRSPDNYLGHDRTTNFEVSDRVAPGKPQVCCSRCPSRRVVVELIMLSPRSRPFGEVSRTAQSVAIWPGPTWVLERLTFPPPPRSATAGAARHDLDGARGTAPARRRPGPSRAPCRRPRPPRQRALRRRLRLGGGDGGPQPVKDCGTHTDQPADAAAQPSPISRSTSTGAAICGSSGATG